MYCADTASARIDLSCFMRWDSAGVRLSRGAPSPMALLLDVLLSWVGGPVTDIVSQASPGAVCGASWMRRWDLQTKAAMTEFTGSIRVGMGSTGSTPPH